MSNKYLQNLNYMKDLEVEMINFVIEMSTNCPNRCAYCFYSYCEEQKYTLKISDLEQLLELIYELSKYKLVTINIQYDGNEGHLRNIINKIYEYRLYHVKVFIQSSGLGINEQLLNLLKFLDIKISFSFDGFFEGARKNKLALDAMNLALKTNTTFGLITVVYNENESRLYSDFKELTRRFPKHFKGIYYNIVYTPDFNMLSKYNVVVNQYKKIYLYIIKNNLKIKFHPLETIFKRFFQPFVKLCDDGGCAAYKRIFALSADGDLFGCDSFIRNNYLNKNNLIKNREKLLNELKTIYKKLDCNKCEYQESCDKFCLGKYFSTNKNFKLLKYICKYNKACNKLAKSLYLVSEQNVKNFIQTFNLVKTTKTYYWESIILKNGNQIKDLNLVCDAISSKYLSNSYVEKINNFINFDYDQFFQIIHNISETFILKWFGESFNINKIESNKYIYYINERKAFFDKKDQFRDLLKKNNFEMYWHLKIETKYFFDEINILLKYPQKNNSYYKKLIKVFTNLYFRVMILLLLEPIYENVSELSYSIELAKIKYNILNNYDIDEYKLKCYYVQNISNLNVKLKTILKFRKKELTKDITKYYLYDIIDVALYYTDAIHGIINKIIQIFNVIPFNKDRKLFNIEYEDIKLYPTILSDFLYFDSVGYKSLVFDKKIYKQKIKEFLDIKQITKKEFIKYYPLILPEMLEND